MEPEELVKVYTLKNANMAELIKNALDAEGIPCRIDGENQAGLAGFIDMQILVRASDADRARALIMDHEPT